MGLASFNLWRREQAAKEAAQAAASATVASDAPEPVNPAPAPAEPKTAGIADLRAVHRGRGSFSVMAGDGELIEGLTKDEAKTFNALTDQAKADFVAARTRV